MARAANGRLWAVHNACRRWGLTRWRWDQLFLMTLLVVLAVGALVRLGGTKQTFAGLRIALITAQADRIAAKRPGDAAALWAKVQNERRGDTRYQALVWSKLLDLYSAAGDATQLNATFIAVQTQPPQDR